MPLFIFEIERILELSPRIQEIKGLNHWVFLSYVFFQSHVMTQTDQIERNIRLKISANSIFFGSINSLWGNRIYIELQRPATLFYAESSPDIDGRSWYSGMVIRSTDFCILTVTIMLYVMFPHSVRFSFILITFINLFWIKNNAH